MIRLTWTKKDGQVFETTIPEECLNSNLISMQHGVEKGILTGFYYEYIREEGKKSTKQYYVRKFINSDEADKFVTGLVNTGVPVRNIKVFQKNMKYYSFSDRRFLTTIVKWGVEE